MTKAIGYSRCIRNSDNVTVCHITYFFKRGLCVRSVNIFSGQYTCDGFTGADTMNRRFPRTRFACKRLPWDLKSVIAAVTAELMECVCGIMFCGAVKLCLMC
jgi:hypothetical protein